MRKGLNDPRYNALWSIHEWSVDRDSREIWLSGEQVRMGVSESDAEEPGVEFVMAARFLKNLRMLELDSDEPILVHMKTCGGNVEEGLAVYDAIRFCPARVTVLSYTHARSMSSYILQAADQRVLMPNSYFLFHKGTFGIEDRMRAVESIVEYYKWRDRQMLDIYVDRMKERGKFQRWSRKRIAEMLEDHMARKTDVYLTPAATVDWGLADKVFDGEW